MSEWYVSSSPVWKAKPMHMLQIRAYDKALAFAAGAGISDMPSEREIAAEEVPEAVPVSISSKRVEFRPQGPQKVDNSTDLEPLLEKSLEEAQNKK
jgi:hypothetical protein